MKARMVLVFVLVLNACHEHAGKMDHLLNENGKLIGKEIDIQKLVLDEQTETFLKKDVRHIEATPHRPLFIGGVSKKPEINYRGDYGVHLDEPWSSWEYLKNPKIKVLVDTTQLMRQSEWLAGDFNYELEKLLWTEDPVKIASYPVVIKNYESDTVAIGYGALLNLFLEAQNRNGEWRLLHMVKFHSCGVGINEILLPPYHYALTATPLYKGNFKTKFRLKLSSYSGVYSNEFYGYMNEAQFNPNPENEWITKRMTESVYRRENHFEGKTKTD